MTSRLRNKSIAARVMAPKASAFTLPRKAGASKKGDTSMKTKRFVSTLLALLLVCSLPVSAFATDDIKPGEHRASIDIHDTVINSYGSVDNNQGTV